MTDELYEFIQDCKDKKITARSARHTRTHCGKGGRVKFPSDYMSKKELEAMNGDCKSYRMNDPMTWAEFKGMPEDLQKCYILALRKKYNVGDKYLAEMFGVAHPTLCVYFKKLGLSKGEASGHSCKNWDKDGFYAWRNSIKGAEVEAEVEMPNEEVPTEVFEPVQEPVQDIDTLQAFSNENNKIESLGCAETKCLVPENGEMVFEGNIHDILRSIGNLLNGTNVHLMVKWDVLED